MGNEAVRWGVLGTALIARTHVIPAIRAAEGCELRAIASRDTVRAQQVADEFGIPVAYGSYEELLADPEIEAVYLPLPNHLHARWIIQAADAGKHVLCEKPLTLNASSAAEVAAHCERRGVLLMEAFMYRFHPAWVEARRLIAEGIIGSVTDIDVWFAFRSDREVDYRKSAAFGGGALYDVGCYAVDVISMLVGSEPDAVLGSARVHPQDEVDTTFGAILDYGSLRATFTCSMELEPDHRFRVYGTGGWLSIDDPFNCPPEFSTTIRVARGGNHHPHASTVESIPVPAADQYGLQATAFAEAVRSGRPAPLPPVASIANARLLDRLFLAAGLQPSREEAITP